VKPAPFAYFAPETLDEALALRAEHADDSVVLAGGQSLIPLLNLRLAQPAVVIDLRRVPDLAGIRETQGGIAIGAMTRQRDAERSRLAAERCPLLGQALMHVAHPTIRNRGTIGGSLAHAFGQAELPAVALALDARLVVRSASRGERSIDARDFFLGFMTTAMEPDELLVEVEFPSTPGRSAFLELARRHGDFALAAVAVVVATDEDGRVGDARIAFAGVAGTAVRGDAGEAALRGEVATDAAFTEAAAAAIVPLDPPDDIHASGAYRRRLAGVLLQRALAEATA
jgi:carbon-monoxide dehydrogenase medium subunit